MIAFFLFYIVLYVLLVFLFVREIKHDRKRYLEADRLADEHILRDVERFLNKMKHREGLTK